MAYQHIKIPSGGEKIKVNKDFSLSVPDNPIIPYIEGDGTGVDITPVMLKVVDAAVKKAYGGKTQDRLDGDVRRREVLQGVRRERVAARGDAGGGEGIRGLDQGAAHHAGRRRHPLDQRGAAPGARPLRLPAAGALVQGRALAAQGARGRRHGDLPRELGGHLRRHRVARQLPRGEEGHRLPDQGNEGQEDPLPEHLGDRHQADLDRGLGAPDPQGLPVRHREQAQSR